MNTLVHFFESAGWVRLLYVLLHTLWQGALIGIILWLGLRMVAARRTELRYGLALGSLAALLIAALVTWSVLDHSGQNASRIRIAEPARVARVVQSDSKTTTAEAMPAINLQRSPANGPAGNPSKAEPAVGRAWVAWGAMIWLLGSAAMSCRLFAQWLDLRRVRRHCYSVDSPPVSEVMARVGAAMGLRRSVGVLTNDTVGGPSVFGVLWPTLLLPPALLVGVSVEQLEAIIAHELAHIRRHDYLVNWAQQVLEALLFFNPAVWWINRQIRIEREACCDRLAVVATGKPDAYAWSLAHWAEQQAQPTPALAPAFGARRNSSGPLDRLKRLLVSEYRPVVRLPWYSFLGVVGVSGILLAGLWQGTHLAVGLAAELLTPAQRIEKLVEIQKKYGQANRVDLESPPQEAGLVSGLVRGTDGAPVLGDLLVEIYSVNGPSSVGCDITGRDGKFESRMRPGKVSLGVCAPGFAPTFAGPYILEPGGTLKDLNIVLSRGFTGRLKVTDETGRPVAGAEINGQYTHPASGFAYFKLKTDADGRATLEHAATNALHLKLTAAGYQYDQRDTAILQPDRELQWVLKPARPTRGLVVARQTGQPIANARALFMGREGVFAVNSGDVSSAPVMATSDAQGHFALTTLNQGSTYTLLFTAPGYAGEFVTSIAPGQEGLRVSLGPELTVKGSVRSDLAKLDTEEPMLKVTTTIRLPQNHSSTTLPTNYPIEIRNGIGHFTFTNLTPAGLALSIGPIQKQIELTQPIDGLVLDLDEKPVSTVEETGPRREVVIRVQVPPTLPLPAGTLPYSYWADADHRGHSARVELTNGLAKVSIPIPGGISIEAGKLQGYWSGSIYQPVPAGEQPYELVLEAVPAGAIFGRVVDVDGSDVGNILVSVVEIEKSPRRADAGSLGVDVKSSASPGDAPTRFAAQPLPLGGTYALLAHHGNTYVLSDPVKLSEAMPIQQIILHMVPGVEVSGRVVDWAQKPVAGAGVSLTYMTPNEGGSFGTAAMPTDSEGRFVIQGVNPNVPGSYSISLRNIPGLQSYYRKVDFRNLPLLIALEKGYELAGRVLEQSTGYPIPGARLTAAPELPADGHIDGLGLAYQETTTDPDGRFRFTTMARRKYQLYVAMAQIIDGRNPFSVQGGQKTEVTLRVIPSPGGDLKPRKPKGVEAP